MKKFIIGSIGGVLLLLCVRAATVAIAPLNIAFMRFLGAGDNIAPTISGTILFVGYIFAVVGPMVGGWVTDKVGNRGSILIGGVTFTAAYFLWAYAVNFPLLYIYRAILALGAGIVAVSMMSFLHATAPEGKKAAGMGLYGLGFGLGSAVGPMVASRLVPTGIREPFLFFAAACLVSLILAVLLMVVFQRNNSGKEINTEDSAEKTSKSFFAGFSSFSPPLYFIFLLSLFFMFGQIAILTTADDFGMQILGLPVGKGIMAIVAFSVTSLLQPLGGMVGDKMGKAKAMMIGVGITALCFFGVALNTASFGLQLVLMAIAGLGGVLYMPNSMALVGDLAPANLKGTALGSFQAAAGIGSATGALISGLIYSATSVRYVFWMAPFGVGLAFVFAYLAVVSLNKIKIEELAVAK